jgi:hypothetical protein
MPRLTWCQRAALPEVRPPATGPRRGADTPAKQLLGGVSYHWAQSSCLFYLGEGALAVSLTDQDPKSCLAHRFLGSYYSLEELEEPCRMRELRRPRLLVFSQILFEVRKQEGGLPAPSRLRRRLWREPEGSQLAGCMSHFCCLSSRTAWGYGRP